MVSSSQIWKLSWNLSCQDYHKVGKRKVRKGNTLIPRFLLSFFKNSFLKNFTHCMTDSFICNFVRQGKDSIGVKNTFSLRWIDRGYTSENYLYVGGFKAIGNLGALHWVKCYKLNSRHSQILKQWRRFRKNLKHWPVK